MYFVDLLFVICCALWANRDLGRQSIGFELSSFVFLMLFLSIPYIVYCSFSSFGVKVKLAKNYLP